MPGSPARTWGGIQLLSPQRGAVGNHRPQAPISDGFYSFSRRPLAEVAIGYPAQIALLRPPVWTHREVVERLQAPLA